jgi:hypothetical protein
MEATRYDDTSSESSEEIIVPYDLPPLPPSLFQFNDIAEKNNAPSEQILDESTLIEEIKYVIPRHKPITVENVTENDNIENNSKEIKTIIPQIVHEIQKNEDEFLLVDVGERGELMYSKEETETEYTILAVGSQEQTAPSLYPSAPNEQLTIKNTQIGRDVEEFEGDFEFISETLQHCYDRLEFAPFTKMRATLDQGYLTGYLLNEEQVIDTFNQVI